MLKNEHAQKSRRERSKQEKLERIEAAARRLFAERGFEATTTRDIAEEAGIATGTLFVYFPEKLDLLVHIYRCDIERVTEAELDALEPGVPLDEACARVFEALYDFYRADTRLARTFVKELMFLEPERQGEMLELTFRFLGRLGQLVEGAQARGEVRSDLAPPMVAHQLFGVYYWCLVTWLSGPYIGRRELSQLMRGSLEALMRGLASELGPTDAGGVT